MAIRVTCTQCSAAYKIDETKIPATGGAVKCQACGTRFAVMPTGNAPPAPAAPAPEPPPDPTPVTPSAAMAKSDSGAIPLPGAAPAKVPQTIHDEVTQPAIRKVFGETVHDEVTKPGVARPAPGAIPLPGGVHDEVTRPVTVPPPRPAPTGNTNPAIPLPAAPSTNPAIPLPAAPPPRPPSTGNTNPAIPLPAAPPPRAPPPLTPASDQTQPMSVVKSVSDTVDPLGTTNPAIPLPGASPASGPLVVDESDDLFSGDKTMISPAPVHMSPPKIVPPPPPAPPAVIETPEEAEPIEEADEILDERTAVAAAPISPPPPEPTPAAPPSLASKLNFDDLPSADEAETMVAKDPMTPPDDLPGLVEPAAGSTASGSTVSDTRDTDDAPPQFGGITLGAAVEDLPAPASPDDATSIGPTPTVSAADFQSDATSAGSEPLAMPDGLEPPPGSPGASDPIDAPPEPLDIPEPLDTQALLGGSSSGAAKADADDELPTPLELEGEASSGPPQSKQEAATQIATAKDRQRMAKQSQGEEAAEERSTARAKQRTRVALGLVLVLAITLGGTAASYFITGELPWVLLNPPAPQNPQTPPPVQLPPVPPAPDFAAIEGKDLDAYTKALAVLDERSKARQARNEPAETKDDNALRVRLLWQGAVLLGSRALAEKLLALPPKEGSDLHPHEERANAAIAFLKGDSAAMQAQLDKLFARDKGDRDAHLLAGYAALAKGDTALAGKHFDEVVKVDDVNKTGPKSIDAYLGHSEIARRTGDRDSAASYVEKAEEAQPQTLRVILARAELNAEDPATRGEAKKSAGEMMKSLDKLGERDRAKARELFAEIAGASGRSNVAIEQLEKAWQDVPSLRLGRSLTWALIGKGDDEAAMKVLAATKRLDDGSYKESLFLAEMQVLSKKGAIPEAQQAIAAAKAAGVEKRATLYADGALFEAQKKVPAALKLYAAAIKADKTFALPMLASIRLAKQPPKVKLLRYALTAKLTSESRAFVAHADALFEAGNFAEAAERYRLGVEDDPWVIDLGKVATRWADALTKSGKTAEGARLAIENTAVDAKNLDTLVTYIDTAKKAGALDEAQRLINLGLDEHPKDKRLRRAEAEVLIAKDNGDRARSVLQQLIKEDENDVDALELMARSYYPKEPDLVKLHIKRAIDLKPAESRYHFLLGQAYLEKVKLDEAHDAFERAKENDQKAGVKNADVFVMLAKVAEQQGRKKEAADAIKEALAMDPSRKALVLELGQHLEDLNQMAEALDLYSAAFKKEPTNGTLAVRMGRIYQQNGSRPNAIKFFRMALKINPNDASAHYRLGYLFKDAGQNKEAIKEFQTYLKLSPNATDKGEIEDEIKDLK
ncbi:MAG: zinc-ribbon domain-containing protein [Deltaproteobacteria bacterium]|nr:zinc-ribbon domain-containing protein [Deltaproteobacteria bacterium]